MSIIGSNVLAGASGSGVETYQIEQSLRFDGGGSKLVLSSPSSSYTTNKFTMSCWVKMGPIASDFRMMARDGAPNNVENVWCNFNAFSNNVIVSYFYTASINGRQVLNTLGTQRDPGAWYHIVFGFDSSTGNTQRIWVNGVEQTTGKDTISGVAGFAWSSTYPFVIGGGTSHGYLAEYHFIDNNWLDSPDDFGEYNDQGVWVPKEYTGSYGTNGFYLKFDPSATNGIGHDHSGTGNHLTASSFTTSGTGTDVMSDTPTTNWCTLNATVANTSNGKATLSEGNLVCSVPRLCAIDSTFGVTSGKYYWEVKPTDLANSPYGPGIFATGYGTTHGDNQYLILTNTGSLYTPGDSDNQSSGWGPTYNGSTDVIGLALDMDNHTLGFNKNGGSFTTYDFSAYITSYKMANSTPCWKSGGNLGTSGATFNFGQRAFEYTAPTGYSELNTSNLPSPTIKDGTDYFNTVLWTGNATDDRDVTGVGFKPDFTWLKERSGANQHELYDAVRGGTKRLQSDNTAAEDTVTNNLKSFITDGFRLGTAGSVNNTSDTYVAWNWLAAGSTSSNTNGSITSTVSASPTSGFSVVSYSGATGQNTVGHGLGEEPDLVFYKRRSSGANWIVYSKVLGTGSRLLLDLDHASAGSGTSNGGLYGSKTFNSTVFSVNGDYAETGANGSTYIAYCFAEVEGYSKFGGYTGNGQTDGVFLWCGFKPAWLLVKRTNTAANWHLVDSARSPYNLVNSILLPDLSDQEATYSNGGVDFVSNGVKIRSTGQAFNNSGDSYIFIAFSENPFGGSGVSPATAR